MRKNKRETPIETLPSKNDTEGFTKFAFTKDKTLVTYVPKKGRCLCLVSTMHHSSTIEETNKPEIIEFYNKTKSGVDALNQKCVTYSTQRRTRRCPMAIFYALLDITSVNSYVLNSSKQVNTNIKRRDFLIDLGRFLINQYIKRQINEPRLPKQLVFIMKKIVGVPINESNVQMEKSTTKRKRCYKCDSRNDTSHSTIREICKKHVCKVHGLIRTICITCNANNESDEDEC